MILRPFASVQLVEPQFEVVQLLLIRLCRLFPLGIPQQQLFDRLFEITPFLRVPNGLFRAGVCEAVCEKRGGIIGKDGYLRILRGLPLKVSSRTLGSLGVAGAFTLTGVYLLRLLLVTRT